MIYSQSRADGIRREKWWVRVVSRPRRGGWGWGREAGARGESEQSQWPASEGVINLKLKFRSSLRRFSLPRKFHRPVLPSCRGCSNRKTRFRGSLWRSSRSRPFPWLWSWFFVHWFRVMFYDRLQEQLNRVLFFATIFLCLKGE